MDEIFSKAPVNEEKPITKKIFTPKRLIHLLIIFLFLNIIYLDIAIFQGWSVKTIEKIIQAPLPQANVSKTNDDTFCSQACITKINEVAMEVNKATPTPSPTPTITKTQTTTPSNATKEYYVPFGTGSSSSLDWQDVSGLQANVDSTAYGSIKSVVFEASLHVPTGNETVAVRLYNATDNHPVWYSELNFSGSTSSVFLSSNKITLDSGNKLYKVQMKTQLQYPAVLDQSRIHITTY